ncbi:MAG: hypothetical protein WD009_00255 [Phycisphaeraceae bacterium]
MKINRLAATAAAIVTAGAGMAAHAQSLAPGSAMYGINRDSGQLARYRFDDGELDNVHTVRLTGGQVLTGIDASTYIPGFQNLVAFWTNPENHRVNLVYINIQQVTDAGLPTATIRNDNVEGGRITGAAHVPNGAGGYDVFVVQDSQVRPFDVEGVININPNNSPDMRFEMDILHPNGTIEQIDRGDLHTWAQHNTGEMYGNVQVLRIRVRPKGGGSQNTLTADGEEWAIQNNNTYEFHADPANPIHVDSLWNAHDGGGTAMGHWWIRFEGQSSINGSMAMATPKRLARVDHRDGTLTELAKLQRRYDSVATLDGETFYATRGQEFWSITLDGSEFADEDYLGEMHPREVLGMDFASADRLLGFTVITNRLYSFDPGDPTVSPHGHASDLGGATNLGTITFVPHESDRGQFQARSYD